MEELATGGAAVVVLADAVHPDHELTAERVEALPPPLSAGMAGQQPPGNAVRMRPGKPLLFFRRGVAPAFGQGIREAAAGG